VCGVPKQICIPTLPLFPCGRCHGCDDCGACDSGTCCDCAAGDRVAPPAYNDNPFRDDPDVPPLPPAAHRGPAPVRLLPSYQLR
jgi:hypothetical protein